MIPPFVEASRCHHLRPTANRLTYRFRAVPKPEKVDVDSIALPHDKISADAEDAIVCRQCLYGITAAAERKLINGAHAHTFANPEGIVFEIVCYQAAWGCAYVGPASPEFTWFPGFLWRIAVCARCHIHLGWRFSSSDSHFFHGLIASRLIFKDA